MNVARPSPFVLAFGDSLTAGYGLATSDAFPAQLETALRRQWPEAKVQNAGVSGDTSGDGLARLPRLLSSLLHRPDLAIVEFGGNDLLRGISPDRTRGNLDAILTEFGRCDIPVLLAVLDAPRFLGALAERCDAVYAELAAKHNVAKATFLPAGILGNPALTLHDRIHPNARAIRMVTEAILPAVTTAILSLGTLAA
jgi:acyl-CoA thioesterase-1